MSNPEKDKVTTLVTAIVLAIILVVAWATAAIWLTVWALTDITESGYSFWNVGAVLLVAYTVLASATYRKRK